MANYMIRNMLSRIQKRFLQSSATLSSIPPLSSAATSSSSYTVDFLVNSCGLSLKSALSVSNKFQLNEKTPQNPQSVLQLFKSHHFSDTDVAQLIVKRPQFLSCRIHNNLQPKFEYLAKNGFQGELLHHIILSNPNIAGASLDSQIKPSFEFLRSFVDSDEKIVVAVRRWSKLLTCNLKVKLQPNIDLLMKEGVPAHCVGKLLTSHPRSIMQKHERMVYTVNFLKKLGFEPSDTTFTKALRVVIQMSESTWKKKVEVMKNLGFNEEEIVKAFKQTPNWLACSDEKIRSSVDFYLHTMKMGLQYLVRNPALFSLSIEKRVRPRYNVFKVLESKGLAERTDKTVSFLLVSEKDFLKKYVDKYSNEVPCLLEMYLSTKEAKKVVA